MKDKGVSNSDAEDQDTKRLDEMNFILPTADEGESLLSNFQNMAQELPNDIAIVVTNDSSKNSQQHKLIGDEFS